MAPTQLAIATSSVNRLLKEESTYRTELKSQEVRLEKLKAAGNDGTDAGNAEWDIKQEVSN